MDHAVGTAGRAGHAGRAMASAWPVVPAAESSAATTRTMSGSATWARGARAGPQVRNRRFRLRAETRDPGRRGSPTVGHTGPRRPTGLRRRRTTGLRQLRMTGLRQRRRRTTGLRQRRTTGLRQRRTTGQSPLGSTGLRRRRTTGPNPLGSTRLSRDALASRLTPSSRTSPAGMTSCRTTRRGPTTVPRAPVRPAAVVMTTRSRSTRCIRPMTSRRPGRRHQSGQLGAAASRTARAVLEA
jgi:hypothetical protein